jgi:E3 ubiquitin-protein ligase RNF4
MPILIHVLPKEPKFSYPIYLNELTEAASTVYDHIFWQTCIKAAN